MPADPVAAGRKGGSRRTPAQLAAARRNGFQPRKPAQEIPADAQPIAPAPPVEMMSQPPACVVILDQKAGAE